MFASVAERLRGRHRHSGPARKAPSGPGAGARASPESQWFWDHYDSAASQVVEAFSAVGLSLSGRRVGDIGCGDGMIDLGVIHKASPSLLVGFDLNLTDTDYLARRAAEEGVDTSGWDRLAFERSGPTQIPADDHAFDFVFSWSAFEHVAHPVDLLREARRILSPHGAFFLQLWPFYYSAKGSHLWEWFPEDHHHLQRPESEIVAELLASDLKPPEWTHMMAHEFQMLNRATVDELQHSMVAAGFVTRHLELLTSPTTLTPELARYSWTDLAISGIKLIATPN